MTIAFGQWTLGLDGEGLPDRNLIGGKAWSVARMQALGLEVPPAFVITTAACKAFLASGAAPEGLEAEIDEGVAWLEAKTGRAFGRGPRPLLVSVRSGAPVSMPGMMDTVLNLGINDETEAALAAECGNPGFARNTHKRFLDLYSHIVLRSTAPDFEEAGGPKAWRAAIVAQCGAEVPMEPREQLRQAVRAVFQSWNSRRARRYREHHNIPDDLGTAVTVLAASAADRDSLAAREAGRVITLGPPPARASYLDANLVVHAAKATGCDALHPGYGFLSERASLAKLCEDHGVAFVGPTSQSIDAVGDKLSAQRLAKSAGVAMTPGSEKLASAEEAVAFAKQFGFPVVTKASAGGGGRGMVVARDAKSLADGFERASTEAKEAFGDGSLYIERYVELARHVEVQAVGLGDGRVLHFGERDCSIQRRYQKMIEEAPARALPDSTRARLREAAVDLLASIRYRNAGTVEFLYDVERDDFNFMEVNARIQVEHPVSEMITGVDLVRLQLEVAGGAPPMATQRDIVPHGHAIEARILAEDPKRGFLPSPGRITRWRPPHGEGVRVDTAIVEGSVVPPYYDSMIAKLIVHGHDRQQAVQRLRDALKTFDVEGVATNIELLRAVTAHPDFLDNRLDTRWLETVFLPHYGQPEG